MSRAAAQHVADLVATATPSDMLGPAAIPVVAGFSSAVYGLVLPETRAMVRRLWSEQPDLLYERPYDDRQDAAHLVFLDAWRRWVSPVVTGLATLPLQYVTNGSSEAIRESVWSLATTAAVAGRPAHLHVFAGEYEGYAAYARGAGVTVVMHDRNTWDETAFDEHAMHRWYVSQPSAIDGNVWSAFPDFIRVMHQRGVEVAVDLAYVGAVAEQPVIDVSSPNIPYVFFSLSKVFGVFYHRVGGVLTRTSMLGLEGNKWFKNMFSLYLGTSLIQATATPMTLPAKYRAIQVDACRMLGEQHAIPLSTSDVILLASSPPGPYPDVFRRGERYRWCLTPTLDRLLQSAEASTGA